MLDPATLAESYGPLGLFIGAMIYFLTRIDAQRKEEVKAAAEMRSVERDAARAIVDAQLERIKEIAEISRGAAESNAATVAGLREVVGELRGMHQNSKESDR